MFSPLDVNILIDTDIAHLVDQRNVSCRNNILDLSEIISLIINYRIIKYVGDNGFF